MKKHYLLMAATVLFIGSCASNSSEKAGNGSPGTTIAEGSTNGRGSVDEVSGTGDDHGTQMLTKADFLAKVMNYEKNTKEWVFEGDKPCLIDFYADWCAPCRITAPILEELAKEYGNRINFYKIDTEKERELAAVFGIQSLPSFLFVPLKGMPTMSSGIARTPEETRQMFRQQIDQLLLQ
jgi:thioredoxin